MLKQEFLDRLREALAGLPEEDIAERVSFYGEMIDDRMEDGLTEEEAVAGIGPVDEIADGIVGDTPIMKIVRERVKPKHRMRAWEKVLLVLGFPVWLPLLIAAFAVLLSVYAVLWAVVICLWAAEVSLIACAAAGVLGAIFAVFRLRLLNALALFGAGLVCAGLAVIMLRVCLAASRGAVSLTKKIGSWIKRLFLRKEK